MIRHYYAITFRCRFIADFSMIAGHADGHASWPAFAASITVFCTAVTGRSNSASRQKIAELSVFTPQAFY